jgi:hypothetical protein
MSQIAVDNGLIQQWAHDAHRRLQTSGDPDWSALDLEAKSRMVKTAVIDRLRRALTDAQEFDFKPLVSGADAH